MIGEPDVAIYLNPVDVELFKQFCQHYDSFKVLMESNVFELRKAKAIVSFNADGVITDIQGDMNLYHRTYPQG